MLQRSDIQLRSMIKSLTDAVFPAIDPNNAVAKEQLQLVIATLGLMQEQLPLSYAFDCDELERLLELNEALLRLTGDFADSEKARSVVSYGRTLLASAKKVSPEQIEKAVFQLKEMASKQTETVCQSDNETLESELKKQVFEYSAEQFLRDRLWVLAQGWEVDPGSLPSLKSLLHPHLSES